MRAAHSRLIMAIGFAILGVVFVYSDGAAFPLVAYLLSCTGVVLLLVTRRDR